MKRASNRIIITTERVNGYGFRVLTEGVDLSQYDKNPLMLWMHKRGFGDMLALGNVVELQKEVHATLGNIITGLPMFDDTDEFAMRIYKKFENGTYRMASPGLRPVEWSEDESLILPGQRGATLIKSQLEEVSLCDIGGNDDALQVALYNDSNELIKLNLKGENAEIPLLTINTKTDMLKIELTAQKAAAILGETEIASNDQFETKVAEVVQLAQRQKTEIETLTREKQDEVTKVIELTQKLADAGKVQLTKDTDTALADAVEARKITADEVGYLKSNVTDQAGLDSLKLFLKAKSGVPTVKDALAASKTENVELTGKSWDDLDRAGKLVKLKADDLNLFKQLYKARFGAEYKD
jgi:hypothetical protein